MEDTLSRPHPQQQQDGGMSYITITLLLMSIAIIQGVFYLLLIPPWQHYDEPGHFEYAWSLAQQDDLFAKPTANAELRQQVLDSMLEHNFFRDTTPPPPGWWFFFTQLEDPPYYYALVSLVLRYGQDSPILVQLYLARIVSLVLFLFTIAISLAIMREMTPQNHPLRWSVPLCLILLPPFVDFMTAVNNNVGAICCSSFFLWGAVRMVRRGFSLTRLLWIIVAAVLATAIKNIAAFLLLLVPIVCITALVHKRGWHWVFLINGGLALIGAALVIGWGDAALWYRWHGATTQGEITRVATAHAPLGTYVLMLTADSSVGERRLLAPILDEDVQLAAGNIVTVGRWLWADEVTQVAAPTLTMSERAGESYHPIDTPVITVTTIPQFIAWHVAIPETTGTMHYVFSIAPPKQPHQQSLYLDGAVVAVGVYPVLQPPEFDDAYAQQGKWGDQRFTNLIRNASAEHASPRLRSWVKDSALLDVVDLGWGRTPWLLLAAFWDGQRSLYLIRHYAGFTLLDSLATRLAWANVVLPRGWIWLFRGMVLVGVGGWVRWLVGGGCRRHRGECAAFLVPLLAVVFAWGFAITRILPKISEGVVYTLAHYTFPAIIPTIGILVAGWWLLFPRQRLRWYVLALGICGMFLLHCAAVWTLWQFYY